MDDKAHAECSICSWGCSGPRYRVELQADRHEVDNPYHIVDVMELEYDCEQGF